MHRLAGALLVVAACGTDTDDRPLDLEYLTQAIFAPSCGATQCHSSFTQASRVVFDHPEAVRRTLVDTGLVRFDAQKYDPQNPANADLIVWISEIDPFGVGVGRMPFDAPLPNRDRDLLIEWIAAPANSPTGDGAFAAGAQCNPARNGGLACNNDEIVRCTDDWNFGELVMTCPRGCTPQASCRP